MRCVPFFIFLFNAAYAIPEEIEGSERATVLSVLTAAGANDEGDRKLTCAAITGCITLNTDCSCASCNTLSNCVAYDPNTCLCTGCSTLYKVNTKGKCVCVPVTGSVLDKKCAVIGCSSGYTYLSTVKKCCPTVDNCGTYDSSTCACTGCVSSIYSLKNGKCVCKTIKGCSQYDSNCNCTGCSSTYVFSSGKCVTQSPTPAPTAPTPPPVTVTPAPVKSCTAQSPCYCTTTNPCTGVQSPGVYDCGGRDCVNNVCKYGCEGATFASSIVTCHDIGCKSSTFNNSVVTCSLNGCQSNVFTNSDVTCIDHSSCALMNVSGGTVNCSAQTSCGGSFTNAQVTCGVDLACFASKFYNTSVTCSSEFACDQAFFYGGACCVSGCQYPPDTHICGDPTPAPTTPTPKPSTPAPTTPAPTTPVCVCANGTAVASGSSLCTSNGATICDPNSCASGYHYNSTTQACDVNQCTCVDGQADSGLSCAADGSTAKCASCSNGYYLDGASCKLKACTCTNGSGSFGQFCPANGSPLCLSCQDGYYLNGTSCSLKKCTCVHGTAATGLLCPVNNTPRCKICDLPNYYLNSSFTCSCAFNC